MGIGGFMKPKYLIGLLAVFWCACLVLVYSFYLITKEEALSQLDARQELLARQAASGIRTAMSHWIVVLESFSGFPELVDFEDKGQEFLDVVFKVHHGDILSLSRLGPEGRILGTAPHTPELAEQSTPAPEYFKKAKDSRKLAISKVIHSHEGEAIAIHVPVIKNGEFLGTLTASINFSQITRDCLTGIKRTDAGYAWLINSDGVSLYCPIPAHKGKSIFDNCRDFPGFLDMARRMLNHESGTAVFSGDCIQSDRGEKRKKRAYFLPLTIGDRYWSIAVVSSERGVLESLRVFKNYLLLLLVVLAFGWTSLTFLWLKSWRRMIEEKKERLAREAIQRSEEKYKRLFAESPVGVYRVSPDWVFESVNPAFAALTGASGPQELVNRGWEDFLKFRNPKHKELVTKRLIDTGSLSGFETLFLLNDETDLWASIFAHAAPGPDPGQPGHTGFLIDITSRKMAEEALIKRSGLESRLLQISAALQAPTSDHFQGNITRALETVGELSGADRVYVLVFEGGPFGREELFEWRRPEKASSLPPIQLIDEKVDPPWLFTQLMEGQIIDLPGSGGQARRLDEGGTFLSVRGIEAFMGVPLVHGARLMGLLGLEYPGAIHNKSEETRVIIKLAGEILKSALKRYAIEKALRESEEKYRLLVDNATDAIYIAQDEVVKFPNAKTEELTGYTAEELAGIPFIELIHPEDREMVLSRHLKRVKGESVPPLYSFRIFDKSGNEKWVQLNTAFIMWEGKPGTLNFIRDMSVQKTLESQLQHAQKMEAVGTLAGGVAHDFNNLLQAINGFTQLLLLEKKEDESGFSELRQIKQAADRAAGLVKQLLAFSRKAETERRPIKLNNEIKAAVGILERTLPKMIEIKLELDDNLRPINADPVQMEQVLLNLCGNAADAMQQRGVLTIRTIDRISAQSLPREAPLDFPENMIQLSVIDNGSGMDEELMQHIFEPFFTTKDFGKGSGLGLASVYGITKSHGGSVYCRSEPGKGTEFIIFLPVMDEKGDVDPVGEPIQRPERGSEKILVVDDEKSVRDIAEKVFTRYGYSATTASSGEEALELLKSSNGGMDLIILDLGMPGMGGHKTLEEIAKAYPHIKVIVASGYSAAGSVSELMQKGASAYLSKPYQINDLILKAREILDGLRE